MPNKGKQREIEVDSSSEDSSYEEKILIKESNKSKPFTSTNDPVKDLHTAFSSSLTFIKGDQPGIMIARPSMGSTSLLNNGNASFTIQELGYTSQAGSFGGGWKTGYRKKNPIGFIEHREKAKSTTSQSLKSIISQLKSSFVRKFPSSKIKLDEILQYKVQVARALDDHAPEDQIKIRHLRSILDADKVKQRKSLRVPRRAIKQTERLEKERKERERKLRGILGRQPLPMDLDDEQSILVDGTFRKQGKIASIPGAGVESHDIQKLLPRQWLNDEVINFYLKMIERRSGIAAQKRIDVLQARERVQANEYTDDSQRIKDLELIAEVKKRWNGIWNVHVFNTFFFEKLSKQGYAGVRQWTRKVDIFTKDLILLPINIGQAHWVCAAINMRKSRFEYYDSMHSHNRKAFQILSDYVQSEYNDKKKGEFGQLDLSGWKRYFSKESPEQANGFDCGVFASMTIEQLSRRNPWEGPLPPPLDAKQIVVRSAELAAQKKDSEEESDSEGEEEEEWNFSQQDMPYLRKRMVYEIATTNLLD
ncbi:hypothetical protein L7F22_042112 [Adiantum nelumboides]|nr:hypothetical protein [Adiantum nelumboides]